TGFGATVNTRALRPKAKSQVSENQRARKRMTGLARSRSGRSRYARSRHPRRYYERFTMSSFASDVVEGDDTSGEDSVVRAAALEALGNMNGTVVAIEPTSGRILAMVNQKLALSSGPHPCSPINLSLPLPALC